MVRLITTRNNPDLQVFEAKNVSIPNQIVLVATVATQNFSCPSNSSPTRVQFSNMACMAQSFFSSTTLLPIKNVQKFYKKFEIQKGPLIGMFFLNTRLLSTVVSAHGAAEVKCRLSGDFFSVDVPPPNPVLQSFGHYRERITFEHGFHARYATLQLFHHDLCV